MENDFVALAFFFAGIPPRNTSTTNKTTLINMYANSCCVRVYLFFNIIRFILRIILTYVIYVHMHAHVCAKVQLPQKLNGIVPIFFRQDESSSLFFPYFHGGSSYRLLQMCLEKSRKCNFSGHGIWRISPRYYFLFQPAICPSPFSPRSLASILGIEILPRQKKVTSKRFGGSPDRDFSDYVRVILRRYQQLEQTWRTRLGKKCA